MIKPKLPFHEICSIFNLSNAAVHSKLRHRKIKHHKFGQRANYLTHKEAKQLFNFKVTPTVVAFELVKGGVGKTSLAFNCAIKASLYGLRCLLIDLDQQANLTRSFGIHTDDCCAMIDVITKGLFLKDNLINVADGIDLFPSGFQNAMLSTTLLINKFPLNNVFNEQINLLKNNYDLILIDCPPDLGAAVTAAALTSDMVIAPVEPDKFSLSGLGLTLNEIQNISKQYGKNISTKIVLNKFNAKTNLSHQTLSNLFSNEQTKHLLFKTFIGASQDFPNAFDNSLSIFDSLKKSAAKTDIDSFVRELIEIIKMD